MGEEQVRGRLQCLGRLFTLPFLLIGPEDQNECLTRSYSSFFCICCSISFLFVFNFLFIRSHMHLISHSVCTYWAMEGHLTRMPNWGLGMERWGWQRTPLRNRNRPGHQSHRGGGELVTAQDAGPHPRVSGSARLGRAHDLHIDRLPGDTDALVQGSPSEKYWETLGI